MAEAKPRRRSKPKASAAFGKLNQLSTSGALSKINAAPEAPADPSPDPLSGSSLDNTTPSNPDPERAPTPHEARSSEAEPTTRTVLTSPTGSRDGVLATEEVSNGADSLLSPSTTLPPVDTESQKSAAADTDQSRQEPGGQTGTPEPLRVQEAARSTSQTDSAPLLTSGAIDPQSGTEHETKSGTSAMAVRRTAPPPLPVTSGFSESRMLAALPPQLADKVEGLPVAYLELANSYRRAQATRTGIKPAKRNMRLHSDVAMAVNRQLVKDKRMLGLKNLKPSQYVDAALTLAQGVSVEELIKAADEFRDSHLGEQSDSSSPNHYSIKRDNDAWLDNMMDELLLANTTGLHGYMINVIIESFLEQLKVEAPVQE